MEEPRPTNGEATVMDRKEIMTAIDQELDDMSARCAGLRLRVHPQEHQRGTQHLVKRVVESPSKEELTSKSAFERLVQTTLGEARMRMR